MIDPWDVIRRPEEEDEEPEPLLRLKDWRLKPANIPGISAAKGLYTAGKAARKGLLSAIGLNKATETGGKLLGTGIKEATSAVVPRSWVEGATGLIPGAKTPSRLVGEAKKNVELGVPSLLALNPLVDFGVTPTDIRRALKKPSEPTTLAKAAGDINEMVGPSWADLAHGGVPLGVGLGIKGLERVGEAKKLAKLAPEAEEIVKDLSKARPQADAARTAYKAAIESGIEQADAVKMARKAAAGLKPPDVVEEIIEPIKPDPGRGKFNLVQAEYYKSAEPALREAAGKVGVPAESAESIASMGRNTIRDTIRGYNSLSEAVGAHFDVIKAIKGRKARVAAEQAVIESLETGKPTGSLRLDAAVTGIRSVMDQARGEAATAMARHYDPTFAGTVDDATALLATKGINMKKRLNYFPQIHETLPDILNSYRGANNKTQMDAVSEFRNLYLAHGEAPPSDDALLSALAGMEQDRQKASGLGTVARSTAHHLENSRTMDIPGYIGDRRGVYRKGDMQRAIHGYLEQAAFRTADARHFGPQGEAFEAALAAAKDPSFKKAASDYRNRIISASSGDPLQAELASPMSVIREVEAANKLGRMGLANAWQNVLVGFPKSFHGVTTAQAISNIARSIPMGFRELFPGGAAGKEALRAGAVYDRMLQDLVGVRDRSTLRGITDVFIKAGQGPRTERANNVVGFHLGKWWGEDLADVIGGKAGDAKLRTNAEHEVRKVLETNPELADQFIQEARAGRDIDPAILDNIGYEFARSVHFRGDPTMVPLKWSTPVGKTITQFKTFGWNTGRFFKEDVVKYGLRTGDLRPLGAMVAGGLVSGEAIRHLKALTRSKEAWDDLDKNYEDIKNDHARALVRAGDDLEASGIFNLLGDVTWSLRHDYAKSAISTLGGPASGDAWEMIAPATQGAFSLMEGDTDKAGKRFRRSLGAVAGNLPIGITADPLEEMVAGRHPIPFTKGSLIRFDTNAGDSVDAWDSIQP